MSTPSRQLTEAFRHVLETMAARKGARMPSREVVANAARLDTAAISRSTMPVQLWHVQGSRGIRYMVALTMESHDRYADVFDGECSCDAGRSDKTCKHLIAILAHAHLDGHRLQS